MNSFCFYQLVLIFSVYITVLQAQQWYDDEVPPELEYDSFAQDTGEKLMDVLKKVQHNHRQQQVHGNSRNPYDDFYAAVAFSGQQDDLSSSEEEYEERDARYLANPQKQQCHTKIFRGVFSEAGYEFVPHEYFNMTCASASAISSNNPESCPCLVDKHKGCHTQTTFKEIPVFRKKLRENHLEGECWERITRYVATGCRCSPHY